MIKEIKIEIEIEETARFWVDPQTNNKWSKDKYPDLNEDFLNIIINMKSCKYCEICDDCINLNYCKNCTGFKDCEECEK